MKIEQDVYYEEENTMYEKQHLMLAVNQETLGAVESSQEILEQKKPKVNI